MNPRGGFGYRVGLFLNILNGKQQILRDSQLVMELTWILSSEAGFTERRETISSNVEPRLLEIVQQRNS